MSYNTEYPDSPDFTEAPPGLFVPSHRSPDAEQVKVYCTLGRGDDRTKGFRELIGVGGHYVSEFGYKVYVRKEPPSRLAIAEELLKELVENTSVPDANCSCHISAPCGDCSDHAGARDLLSRIESHFKKYAD